jgi:hypothetical protein
MTANQWALLMVILALLGLGFAAMSTNPSFTIPNWIPTFFFIAAGLMSLWFIVLVFIRRSRLKVAIQNVRIGTLLFDDRREIIQFFISLTLEAHRTSLGALDLVFEDKPLCKPLELPTKFVKRKETYEVEYRVPGDGAGLLLLQGELKRRQAPDNEWPQAYFHVLAGGLNFNTRPFPILTPDEWLTLHKKGYQI